MDKNNIKNLLNQTFVNEAKVPGLDVTNKVKADNGKINKKAIKDVGTELSSYDKESKKATKDATKPVKFNYTDDSEEEYHKGIETMGGEETIQYDRTPSEKFKKRAEDAIAGATYMGNNPEWANVVAAGQGGDPEFGKKLVKAIKASVKRRSDDTPTTKMFGDDWEVVKDHSHKSYAMENKENNKETIKESEKMKRLKFKKPFNGVSNALNLIPENYKVDNKVFEMSDGNESYKVRWEGSLNEGKGIVLIASDATLVNEDVEKMKHLMGYNSKDTLGTLKGSERINEDKKFSDIWSKTKSILNENIDEWTKKQLNAFDDGDHDDKPFEPIDMAALRKDESMDEMDATGGMDSAPVDMSRDTQRLDTLLDKNSTLTAAISKIDTPQELVDTMSMMYRDILKNKPQLASAQNKLISALKNVSRQGMTEMGGMSEMDKMPEMDKMSEMDRFDEVFSGLDDEDDTETMEEGKMGDFFRKVGSSIGGFEKGIEKGLQKLEGQQLEKSFMESDSVNDWYAKHKFELAKATAPGGLFDTAGGSSVQAKDVVDYLRKKKTGSKVTE